MRTGTATNRELLAIGAVGAAAHLAVGCALSRLVRGAGEVERSAARRGRPTVPAQRSAAVHADADRGNRPELHEVQAP